MTLTVMRKSFKKYQPIIINLGHTKIFLIRNIERHLLIICPKKILIIMMMVSKDSVT